MRPSPSTLLEIVTFVILIVVAVPQNAFSQQSSSRTSDSQGRWATLEVIRLARPIELDGIVSAEEWDSVPTLELTTHWPEFGIPPTEETEIRFAYDDDYVYVSCRCYAAPENVFAASFKRDLQTLDTDYLSLALDTFNDNENAVTFSTTPTGSRLDVTMSGDAASNDNSWNTFWDAEVTTDETGWFAEMRIPFSSLRYQVLDDKVIMGVAIFRYLGRKNEMHLFPAIPPNWGFWSFNKPSRFQKVTFHGVPNAKPIYVTPYALAGLGQEFDLNKDNSEYIRSDDRVTEIGADIKYGLTNNLTLDVTVNTDFAQVEADNQQVNLTRFSLFFPEKRRFFLERASIFDFNFGGSNRLFYSRRIGLADGQAVRILGGARVVGRVGSWDIGMIDMQTSRLTKGLAPEDKLPAENFGVLRLRRRVLNPNSFVGGIVTTRIGDDGSENIGYGLDATLKLFGDTYALVNWAQTFDDENSISSYLADPSRFRMTIERQAYTGFVYAAAVERAGSEYMPDMGFEVRSDFTSYSSSIARGWGSSEGSPFARHQVGLSAQSYLRNKDNSLETLESGLAWGGQLLSGAFIDVGTEVVYEDLQEDFELSEDASVLAGTYTSISANGRYETTPGKAWRAVLQANGGEFFDGYRISSSIEPKFIVSKYLEVSGGYEINHIRFPDRDQMFTAHIGRIRIQAAANTKLSLSAFLQMNSSASAGIANIRVRYNPREGNDFFIVFNEGFNTNRLGVSPAQPFTDNRALLLKYTYTFAL